MKAKQLILLVIAGVVLGGIAWWTSRDDSGESSLVGTKLLAGVDLNSIDEIIVSAGSDTCRMVRDEKGWVVPSRYGYAANFSKIRNLLIKLDGLEIGQIAEVREDQKSELGVTAAAGTNIKLYAGGNELAALLLGDQRERQSTSPGPRSFGGFPDGRYISADGGTTVNELPTFSPSQGFTIEARVRYEVPPQADATVVHRGEVPADFALDVTSGHGRSFLKKLRGLVF